MISAIVLAAGESKRMGKIKQLLPWRGKAVLQHVLDNLLASRVDEIILVLGYEAGRILEKVGTGQIKVLISLDYPEGMSASIREGLRALDEQAEAFLIVLGDQPRISKEVYDRLIDTFQQARPKKSIILPTYKGRRGHPVLFSLKYLKEAMHLKGDVGCRQILADHPEEILAVEMDTDAILDDIDTPEAYEEYLEQKA